MALTFPTIDPIALSVGPLQIRWYALAYLVGILVGWAYALWIVKKDVHDPSLRPNKNDLDDYLPFAVLGIILGGRIGYILFYQFEYYLHNPLAMLQIWAGGMSFHGGLLGVVASILLYAGVKKFNPWRLSDIVCAVAPIGICPGRFANFINGELYGRVTSVPWGMVFPGGGDEPRHPSQIYQALLEGALLFVILAFLISRTKIRSKPGIVTGAFFVGYGILRFGTEFFREPDWYLGFVIGALSMGQVLCLPMIAFGAGVILWASRKPHVHPAA